MRLLVESFKRLYLSGKIDEATILARLEAGKITEQEYNYIVNEE